MKMEFMVGLCFPCISRIPWFEPPYLLWPAHADTQRQLRDHLHQFFARYADPKWDLWKGGKSKSGLLTADLFGLGNITEGAVTEPCP